MKAVVQRVREASVKIGDETVGSIGPGLLVYLGITDTDTRKEADKLVDKLIHLRIFDDENGVPNRSVLDESGAVLLVSQFTLYADTAHGRRPSYIRAAKPETALPLYEYALSSLSAEITTACGRFGANMQVSSVNDGPFTILMEI